MIYAAAVVLMSRDKAEELGIKTPCPALPEWQDAQQAPDRSLTQKGESHAKAIAQAGLADK